jgi:asparagine synthase (glutamine-hydrolysing)
VVANTLLRESGDSHQQLTFSASAEDSRYDEMGWADMVTAKTGVQSHKVCPKLSDLFEASKAITWHQDEPFASTSIYAQWRVFELAANAGVKVMLDGQGADEQLAGYHGFFSPYLASLWKTAKFSELLAEMSTLRSMHGYSSVRSLQFLLDAILPNALRQQGRRLLGRPHANPHWLSLAALNAEPIDPFLAWRGTASPDVRTYSIAQMKSSQLQMLLHWEDRDSMAHSIESRVPFLDHRLVEFVVGLPDAYKLQGGVTKRVLREGMTGLLPEPVRMRRDKVGFATPEDVWMRTASNEFLKRADWAIETAGGVLKAEAKTHVRKIINGSERFSSTPWRMICFAEWLQTYAVK